MLVLFCAAAAAGALQVLLVSGSVTMVQRLKCGARQSGSVVRRFR